jgi:predicted PurR-regulated permease PerM
MTEGALSRAYKSLMIILIIVLALIYAGDLIMPILFSGMIAVLLNPFHSRIESLNINRGFAAFLVVLLSSILLLGLILMMAVQSQGIVQEMPKLMQESESFLTVESIEQNSNYLYDLVKENIDVIEKNLDEVKASLISLFSQGVTGLRDALFFLILCPIYVFFMLLCKGHIYRFIRGYHPKKDNEDVLENVKHSLYNYLRGLFLIMTISGTLTFIGLYIVGIEYALFLGALTALLSPIPYIGVFISALIPVLLALLTKDSIWYTAGVLIVFAIVQFLESYVFTPKIMGDSVNINPLIIVIGLILFGSLTGIIGMIMTVPLLAIIKVIIDYYPHLKPWKHLLEDEESK